MRFNFKLTANGFDEAYNTDGTAKTGMETGALLIPKDLLTGNLDAANSTDQIEKVTFNQNDDSGWTASADGDYTNYVYVYDFPQAAYNREVSVVGYYLSGGAYTYTSVVTRSMAEVANSALKESSFTPEQEAILNSYLINYDVTVKTSDSDAGTTYSVKYGAKLSSANDYQDPTKDGYSFGGFKSANDGKIYAANSYTVKGADTLTAQWQKYKPDSFNTLVAGTTNEYMLADYTSMAYSHLLSTTGSATFTQSSEGLTYTGVNWSSSYVTYTLPEQINLSEIESIKVYAKKWDYFEAHAEGGKICAGDTSGNTRVFDASAFATDKGAKLTSFKHTAGNGTYTVEKVTYVKKVPMPDSFNTLVAGTTNEYLLADFTNSDYTRYLSAHDRGYGGFTKPTYSAGTASGLTYSGASWSNEYVKYTLPNAIKLSEIESLTFNMTCGYFYWVDSEGDAHYKEAKSLSASDFTEVISKNADMALAAIYFTGDKNQSATSVTYTKKA